eukprot:XP_001694776.1 predicted protein [Chlamydomonas reinhardtii]
MSLWGCEELYVTGLHAEVTDIECRNIFGTHGAVKEAVIVQKKGPSAPGAPQSCIVRMMNHLDAVKAKKALNKTDWNGKQISVKWSHNQRVLWVTNLHEAVTNEVRGGGEVAWGRRHARIGDAAFPWAWQGRKDGCQRFVVVGALAHC